jgi:hypothetical protein
MSEETPVTLSIDSVGSPRITARYVASEAGGVEVSSGSPNEVGLVAAPGSQADVNVANGLSSVDFDLPDGLGMNVYKIVNGVSDIEYVDEDGNVVGEFAIDAETESGEVIDAVAEFDEETGEFYVTEEVAEEETIDELPDISNLSDDEVGADEGADSGANDDPGQDDSGAGTDSGDGNGPDDATDPTGDDPGADDPGADDPGADDPGADDPAADPVDDSGQE